MRKDRVLNMITCTCASIPPTIPVYRDHHLPECEISIAVGVPRPRLALLAAGIAADPFDALPLVLSGEAARRAAALVERRRARK